jgi:hypothetical protein
VDYRCARPRVTSRERGASLHCTLPSSAPACIMHRQIVRANFQRSVNSLSGFAGCQVGGDCADPCPSAFGPRFACSSRLAAAPPGSKPGGGAGRRDRRRAAPQMRAPALAESRARIQVYLPPSTRADWRAAPTR